MINVSGPWPLVSILVMFATLAWLMRTRLHTILGFYQQEEYDSRRFWKAWLKIPLLDIRTSLALVATVAAHAFLQGAGMWALWLFSGFVVYTAQREARVNAAAKKKLNMTQRARRLYQLAAIFMVLTSLLWLLHLGFIWLWLQLTPLAIMAANAVLAPLQKRINNGYIDDARDRLAAYEGRIIGITGSFGKTTTKHILGHALEGLDHVFYSPGSINTVLGHTLQIRKHLSPQHGYFIAEMGAYGKGSIQRLCDFIPPQIAMVTAVGAAHYERFKTLETVAEAKSELPQAALQHAQGRAYLHDSVMVYAPFQDLKASAPTRVIVCGPEADSDVRLLETTTSLQGTEIQVSYKGLTEHYRLPILGQHNVGNLLLVVAFLRDEGFSEEEINIALRSMPQISHRLEQRETGSYTLLDDAYNSNPSGFRSALGVLNDLGQEKGGRRILITPGMVELGAQHAEAHAEIGALLGQTCDVLLAVRPDRIPTLVSKAKEGGVEVHAMPSFAAARAWLEQNAQPQDVVLIENDLPDLLEARRLL